MIASRCERVRVGASGYEWVRVGASASASGASEGISKYLSSKRHQRKNLGESGWWVRVSASRCKWVRVGASECEWVRVGASGCECECEWCE